MYCPGCGREIIEGTRFCANCGKAIRQTTEPNAMRMGVYSSIQKNKKLVAIIVGIIAVIVILVCVGVAGLSLKKKPLSENQIAENLKVMDSLCVQYENADENWNEVSFHLDSRRTDSDAGIDYVTGTFRCERDDFVYQVQYELYYRYFDRGWILEDGEKGIEKYEINTEPELNETITNEIIQEEGWKNYELDYTERDDDRATVYIHGIKEESYYTNKIPCDVCFIFDPAPGKGWIYESYITHEKDGYVIPRGEAFVGTWELTPVQLPFTEKSSMRVDLLISEVDFDALTITYAIAGRWYEAYQNSELSDYGTGDWTEGKLLEYELYSASYYRTFLPNGDSILLSLGKGVCLGYGVNDLTTGDPPYIYQMDKVSAGVNENVISEASTGTDQDDIYRAEQPYNIPDWYEFEKVVVKDNMLCFGRATGLFISEYGYVPSVYVYFFGADGRLEKEVSYDFFPTEDGARQFCEDLYFDRNPVSGKNGFGHVVGDAQYTWRDRVLEVEYAEKFITEEFEKQMSLIGMADVIQYYQQRGWEIVYK